MSRKIKSLLVYTIYLLLVVYMVYESVFIIEMKTYEQFLNGYFKTVQKHLFNIMMIISFYLIIIKVPYLKPEFRVRYRDNLLYKIVKDGCIISFKWTVYIYSLFIIVPFLFSYDILISHWLADTSRLFTYIFYVYILSNVLYIMTGNELRGILICWGLNFLILAGYLGVSFYIVQGGIPEEVGLNYLLIFSSILNVLGVLYLHYYFKFEDSLQ